MKIFGKAPRLNQDGTTAVEFALVSPAVIVTIVGIFELAVIAFIGSLLESAVLEASRYGVTGYAQDGITREERIADIIHEWSMGLIELDDINITTLIYQNFSDIGQPETYTDENGNGQYDAGESFVDVNGNGVWDEDLGEAGLGGPNDIVLYKVTYSWGMLTGLLETLVGPIEFTSTVAVRNEPY